MIHLLVSSLLITAPVETEEKPGVAALEIDAVEGVKKSVAGLLSEMILSQLKESGQFGSVLGSSDIQSMLDLEQQKQALDCDENSCLAELGGALGVPYLLTSSLGAVGGKLVLNVKLIQVDEAKVANRLSRVFADEAELLAGLNPAVDGLLEGAFKESNPLTKTTATVREEGDVKVPWLALSLGLAGAGLAGWGYLYAAPIRADFDQAPTVQNYDLLKGDIATANQLVAGGWSLLAGATFTWWWSR